MGAVKITQVDGDLSVRNVSAGGHVNVEGSVTVGHNLKVEGWLEAPNIKDVNKGVFEALSDLNASYPQPHNGWVAGVVSGDVIKVYVGTGGAWVETGASMEYTGDIASYTAAVEELVAGLGGKQDTLEFDAVPTNNSDNPVTSNGVFEALQERVGRGDVKQTTGDSTTAVMSQAAVTTALAGKASSDVSNLVANLAGQLNGKQDRLEFDAVPTAGSQNPVRSGGVQSVVAAAQARADGAQATAERAEGKADAAQASADAARVVAERAEGKAEAAQATADAAQVGLSVKADASAVYTKAEMAEILSGYVPSGTEVNGHALESDIEVSADEVPLSVPLVVGDVAYTDVEAALGALLAGGGLVVVLPALDASTIYVNDNVKPSANVVQALLAGRQVVYVVDGTGVFQVSGVRLPSAGVEAQVNAVRVVGTTLQRLSHTGVRVSYSETTMATQADLSPLATQASLSSGLSGLSSQMEAGLSPRLFFNGNVLLGLETCDLNTWLSTTASEAYAGIKLRGVVVTLWTSDGLKSFQWKGATWGDVEDWKEFGGSAAVGNCYNVTNEVPRQGYYTLETAVQATFAKGFASSGMQITFAIGEGSWKTYQYVGSGVDRASFTDLNSWLDMAGMSAGSEPVINVTELCGLSPVSGANMLTRAISALADLSNDTGIEYRKGGLVITYKVGDQQWETKQFIGSFNAEMPDVFADESLWVDFGGGGSDIETSDTPVAGGLAAFTTGGAYTLTRRSVSGFDVTQDEDNLYLQPLNSYNEEIGDVITIPKGGGGSSDVSTLSIYFEEDTPSYSFGGVMRLQVAVKSVSYDGGEESYNNIRTLSVVDDATGVVLLSETLNSRSSRTATDWIYTLDFGGYFTSPGTKDFWIVATDVTGATRRRLLSVNTVDVTVRSARVLNYTSGSSVATGGGAKSFDLFRFPNYASQQGIRCVVEMYYGGEWRVVGETLVTDSYPKSVTLNASDVFGGGERLEHGSYMLRVQGEDIKTRRAGQVGTGIKGNILYESLMCVDSGSSEPVVALRYYDNTEGSLRLYDTLSVDVAVYTPGAVSSVVDVLWGEQVILSQRLLASRSATVSKLVQGYASDGSATILLSARSGVSVRTTPAIAVVVSGSAIDAETKGNARFCYDFSTRSNSESDHSISDNGITMAVRGANWSSNGFVSMEAGGEMSLRVAENVTAEIPYSPFGGGVVSSDQGLAVQFAFATKNVKNDDALLIDCFDASTGAGFYVKGNEAAIYCKDGVGSMMLKDAEGHAIGAIAKWTFREGEKVTMTVVVEPTGNKVKRGEAYYSLMKMYLNGEEVACIGYPVSTFQQSLTNEKPIRFDGSEGDLYLYYIVAYSSYMSWSEAFRNYLCRLSDSSAMISEYNFENVLDNLNRPSLRELSSRGIPYYVVVADQSTFDKFDGGIDTGDKTMSCTLIYNNPSMPWRSFKAENVQWRRQGTTSAKRPVKNDRFYLRKNSGWRVTPLNGDYTNEDALMTYRLMEIGYVRVGEATIPVNVITVKVDYSDSSGANDCGVCDLMNGTYRELGTDYMTPAQLAFAAAGGRWSKSGVEVTGLELNHSTANHPIACFRATNEGLTDAWFHAKGNWKEDKGEQVALGFKDTAGYNLGCLNYGDFVEYFGEPGETLQELETRFKADATTDASKIYLLSQYCGRDYRLMEHDGSGWTRCHGEMSYNALTGEWTVVGKVLNPVSGYELLQYDGLDWWMGVGSVSDMMEPVAGDGSSWVQKLKLNRGAYPRWTYYFECMIDDDQLQVDLALGRKVPFELYNLLLFCNSCDYSRLDEAVWKARWKSGAWKYMNLYSLITYYAFTDYLAAVDQQAKNMQPMFFLERGARVVDGVYTGVGGMEPVRMYPNKVYDCDTCNGKDNDGYPSIVPTLDPGDLSNQSYAGRGSVLWNALRGQPTMEVDNAGNEITLAEVVGVVRGTSSFSIAGALDCFVTRRLKRWPKVVSSFDGERKYISFTETSDSLYFYALQGLGLTSLPRFIEERWRYRDGYYRTGEFKSADHYISGRIGAKTGAMLRMRAGKDGYFAVGNDSGNVTEAVWLRAGESYTFTNFAHGDNVLLYLYNADLMSELDLSEISLAGGWNFSRCVLLEKLSLGSASHGEWTLQPTEAGFLTTLDLGGLPFLRELDVRCTELTSVDASKCPRLERVLASGTVVTVVRVAETSPLVEMLLPATIETLELVNLPELSYPGGLQIEGMSRVKRVRVDGCAKVDGVRLLTAAVDGGAKIEKLRLSGSVMTGASRVLRALLPSSGYAGATGIDSGGSDIAESGRCSGLTGRWLLSDFVGDDVLQELRTYFRSPDYLELYNSQYTVLRMVEGASDIEATGLEGRFAFNIVEEDRGSYGESGYVASGHVARLRGLLHTYVGSLGIIQEDGVRRQVMSLRQLRDDDLNHYVDGGASDLSGSGDSDVFVLLPHYWFKGVNDFRRGLKYLILSTEEGCPISSSGSLVRSVVDDLEHESGRLLLPVGQSAAENDWVGAPFEAEMVSASTEYVVAQVDVRGKKQVRWPGINSGSTSCVFLDEAGVVIEVVTCPVEYSLHDFVDGMYVFTRVPEGAVRFLFSCRVADLSQECIVTDSAEVEAIEPDWVEHEPCLIGAYKGYIGSDWKLRSISGVTMSGSNSYGRINGGKVWTGWEYGVGGAVEISSMPSSSVSGSSLDRSYKDIINLGRCRGAGYQCIDYNMHRDLVVLWMAFHGGRDSQSANGTGTGSGTTTGGTNDIAMGESAGLSSTNVRPRTMGFEDLWGNGAEWLDNVLVNVSSLRDYNASFDAQHKQGDLPVASQHDQVWHILEPDGVTEREVLGCEPDSNIRQIVRMRWGRYCDVVPSATVDNGAYDAYFCDGFEYNRGNSKGLAVARGGAHYYAQFGLAYVSAFYPATQAYSTAGSRLAFRGEIVIAGSN